MWSNHLFQFNDFRVNTWNKEWTTHGVTLSLKTCYHRNLRRFVGDASRVVCMNFKCGFTCSGVLSWRRMLTVWRTSVMMMAIVNPWKKPKRFTRDTLRQRERRPVWHWPKMHHASCVWTSCAKALHGVTCGGVLSWLCMWMARRSLAIGNSGRKPSCQKRGLNGGKTC